ncbi:putative receptor-like protein kinase At3g46340 isoform X1 [Capsella rubella]|uniref:putative receptor-like protein kinase At3g46340 isoform X1 n=1 Tax=Capsella rubella TaxID=81985 RepID=UPI000CD4E2C9|nr:putative receptor-like protein kinase At3g46340 isoform X1 [Capsella rubella]
MSSSLKLIQRLYLTQSKTVIRYPKDDLDRIWEPHFQPEWTQISTVRKVDNANSYLAPHDILMTAAIPANANEPLSFTKYLEFPNDNLHMYFHFAEVQALQANQTRRFTIFWNDRPIFRDLTPPYLNVFTVYTYPNPFLCQAGECLLEIKRTQISTLPPLLCAIEILAMQNLPQSETNEDDVSAMKNIKATYGLSRISWQGDPCVPRQFSWDGLICNDTNVSTPPRITSLNLSSSGLTGTIAPGIQNLINLQTLDLSNNNLTGKVPEFLANMKSLLFIDLRNNKLHGLIPRNLLVRSNAGLQLFVSYDTCLSSSCVQDKKFPMKFVALASSAVVVIAVVLTLFFLYRKKKRSSLGLPPMRVMSTSISGQSIETQRRRFTYSEVVEMTENFQNILGEGGFGIVYHGYLNGSEQVAVKVLSQSSSQGYKHFKAEVELLLRVHHVNLVSLVGYCDEGDHLALIYECMSNGDLKDHLSGKKGKSVLKWSTRLRIAVDAALGSYLTENRIGILALWMSTIDSA